MSSPRFGVFRHGTLKEGYYTRTCVHEPKRKGLKPPVISARAFSPTENGRPQGCKQPGSPIQGEVGILLRHHYGNRKIPGAGIFFEDAVAICIESIHKRGMGRGI